jgi:hypothetical protein
MQHVVVCVAADCAAPKAARSEYESFLTAVAGLLGGDLPSQELYEAAEQVTLAGWGGLGVGVGVGVGVLTLAGWGWGCWGRVQQQGAAESSVRCKMCCVCMLCSMRCLTCIV